MCVLVLILILKIVIIHCLVQWIMLQTSLTNFKGKRYIVLTSEGKIGMVILHERLYEALEHSQKRETPAYSILLDWKHFSPLK